MIILRFVVMVIVFVAKHLSRIDRSWEFTLSNAILTAEQLHQPETWFPLAVYICDGCQLAQLEQTLKTTNYLKTTTPTSVATLLCGQHTVRITRQQLSIDLP